MLLWVITQGVVYKIYRLTQLSIKQLLLKDISSHISQLHVSARFYGAETCSREIQREIFLIVIAMEPSSLKMAP